MFIPVVIDAERVADGAEMVRVTYFAVTTDAPAAVWEVELPAVAQLHGIGALGLAGVIYSAMRESRAPGQETVEFDLFTDADDVAAIFALEESGDAVDGAGRGCMDAAAWFEDEPRRGDVYRVALEAFQDAYRYTAGTIDPDVLMERDASGRVISSPLETEAVMQWSQDQIDASRRAFPDKEVKLRWRMMAELAVTIIDVGWETRSWSIRETMVASVASASSIAMTTTVSEPPFHSSSATSNGSAGTGRRQNTISSGFCSLMDTPTTRAWPQGDDGTFGTTRFWYPKSVASTTYGVLLDFANRSNRVLHHQAVDETKILEEPEVTFHCGMRILWPNFDQIDTDNENNNSVVLALTLGEVTIVLTGDAEAENWPQIVDRLPSHTTYLQVPHHGGRNGLYDPDDGTPWLDRLSPRRTRLVMSSHVVPPLRPPSP